MNDDDKKAIAKVGVRVGVASAYLPAMLKGRVMALKAMLFRICHEADAALPDGGATAMPRSELIDDNWYLSLGFCPAGPIAIRADELERMLAVLRRGTKEGEFAVSPDILSRIDAPAEVFARMLRSQGYEVREDDDGIKVTRPARVKSKPQRAKAGKPSGAKKKPASPPKGKPEPVFDPDSPFAKLQELKERLR